MKILFYHTARFCKRSIITTGYVLLLLFYSCDHVNGQSKTAAEYQIKAVFLYNFTQFIDWPATAYNSADDPFVIGIIGNNPFDHYLEEVVAEEKIGNHPIEVRYYRSIREIGNCHILYINSDDQGYVEKVLSSVAEKNILTVSDAPNFNRWGGIVRFFTEENKIRLQINVEQSKAARLNISSKLLSVAKTK